MVTETWKVIRTNLILNILNLFFPNLNKTSEFFFILEIKFVFTYS